MPNLSFEPVLSQLRRRLSQPLPGTQAQLQMAPAYRLNPSVASIENKDCREAGVLILFFPVGDTPTFVLTVRRDDLPDHAGQVSLPGGQREDGEPLQKTALREAYEEVNITPDRVDMVGRLTPLYIPPSQFCVYPYVGAVSSPPSFQPTNDEVDSLLCIPLDRLLDPATLKRETWTLDGEPVDVPFFHLDGHKVWGATAMILAELRALCEGLEEAVN